MRRTLALILVLSAAISFAGCKRSADPKPTSAPRSMMAENAVMEPPPASQAGYPAETRPSQGNDNISVYGERKMIYTAELKIEVKDYDEASARMKTIAEENGGFVADSHVDVDPNGVRSGEIKIRVPAAKFAGIISGIKGIGKVKYEAVHGQDITEEYFDLETRLANAKKMEERLLDLLQKQTKSVKDLLEVERELGRVREDIETKEGRKRFLDDRLSLSTITVELYEPLTYTSSVFDPLRDAWSSIWSDLIVSLSAVISFVFSALPWAVLTGFVVWTGIKLVRRWLKKKNAD